MKILVGFRQDIHKDKPVECYARSVVKELEARGCDVTTIGEGLDKSIEDIKRPSKFDLFLELDNGRNSKGEFCFQQPKAHLNIPSAVWFIDSHGHPTLHHRLARHYEHVFFAVFFRRDLFANHPSAHWCPNATDMEWFGWEQFNEMPTPTVDFGFFGSKGGLDRANPMKELCEKHKWTCDVRQLNKPFKHRWPHTGEAMWNCWVLFNHGQKHDLNLRVFESMAIRRPLINDYDPMSGIDMLFAPEVHYIPYESYTYEGLEEAMKWVYSNPAAAAKIAQKGYTEVREKHTIGNRVDQILEVVRA